MDSKKTLCHYPSCKKEAITSFDVKLIDEPNANARLPFCKYHWFIVSANHFECNKTKDHQFVLQGPFQMIEIIEQVDGAIQIMKELKAKEAI